MSLIPDREVRVTHATGLACATFPRGRATLRLVLALTLAALLLPATSVASSASVHPSGTVVFYTAAAGEDNDVTVSLASDNYTIRDPGETITPTAPCTAVSSDEVTCPAAGIQEVNVELGDLDDDVTINGSFRSRCQGGAGSDHLNGGSHIDVLRGGDQDDFLDGGAGDVDDLSGEAGDDVETGGPGIDVFLQIGPTDGADVMNGGADTDTATYSIARTDANDISLDGVANDGDVGANGGAGEGDNVGGVANDVENVSTGSGADEITGNDAANHLNAGSGEDTMSGGAGDDTFREFQDSDGPDTMHGGSDVDTADYAGRNAGDGAHSISLDGVANDGASTSDEGDNVDADIENVRGGNGSADTITGDGDPNELFGFHGGDDLRGGGANDTISDGTGTDAVNGDEGDDTIVQDSQLDPSDALNGGAGEDLVDYSSRPLALTITLDKNANDGSSNPVENDNVGGAADDVENVTGGLRGDVIDGNEGPNELQGGPFDGLGPTLDTLSGKGGADALDGGGGPDTENGGAGNDTFHQGGSQSESGNDTLNGGDAVDTADYRDRPDRVQVRLDTLANDGGVNSGGEQDNVGGAANDVENVRAGSAGQFVSSFLVGNGLANELTGGTGGDNLQGQGGNDRLDGGEGADNLEGGGDDDRLLSRDASADTDNCGDGTADVAVADAQDTVDPSCEQSPPLNTGPPTISGSAHEDETLTTTDGTWSGAPTPTFSYQWRRCDDASSASCADIPGATGPGYDVVAADVGKRLRSRVTATNAADTDSAESGATDPVLANPDTEITSGLTHGALTADPTPTFGFRFRSGTGSDFECKVDGGSFSDCNHPHTLPSQANGPHAFEVRAVDASGHPDPSPEHRDFTVDATSPAAGGAPTHTLPQSVQMPMTTIPVSVGWPVGGDNMTAQSQLRYELYRQRRLGSTFGAATRVFGPATGLSSTQQVTPGQTYRFGDRAIDRAGNASAVSFGAALSPRRLQESPTSALVYGGTWRSSRRSTASGGAVRYSTQVGATATLTFSARQVGVVMPRRSSLGSAQICVDLGRPGQFCRKVDLSPPSGVVGDRVIVFARAVGSGKHRVRVKVTSGRADLDALTLLG